MRKITGTFPSTSGLCRCRYYMYLPDKPSKQTVYGWVNQRLIPYHKTTKRLSFLKSEIDAWIANGRRKTAKELRDEAVITHGYRKGSAL